jgi:ABC-type antimicrobial peptide transport system permease subunit
MKHFHLKSIFRSLSYYGKDAVYQVIIVALLTAVITGSLLTGESVRESLRKAASEKLGNTDIVISSGLRYFDPSVADRIYMPPGEKAMAILEENGYCQNFSTGVTALNTKIFGVCEEFFLFNSGESQIIEPGTAVVNSRLAQHLEVKPGDEIIIHFRTVDPIPANAPFAPKEENQGSKVLRVSKILSPEQSGNFSLGISQIAPMNVFMNIKDVSRSDEKILKANRLLIHNSTNRPESFYSDALSAILTLSDIGLSLRRSSKTGEPELISNRIFIDSTIVATVIERIPSATPVLTYLANSISFKDRSTPYSFISSLTSSLPEDMNNEEIIINRWLADDLGVIPGDSLAITWFVQGSGGRLEEKGMMFLISGIVDNNSSYADPSLMPDFPGISGSTTCSDWDAGIPLLLDRIREKDEEYWNIYKGTPKAFISYETGKKLWSNNFGSATAIRFPVGMPVSEIENRLAGSIVPAKSGFTIKDIRRSSEKAADEGIDFGSLFMSLSIFIIISCIVLLSMAVSIFFDSRKQQVRIYFALGFRRRDIKNMLFAEAALLSGIGAIPGVFIGYLMNMLIITALNSVWSGAVQTDTLSAGFSVMPLLYGFILSVLITSLLINIKARSFLASLSQTTTGELKVHSARLNNIYLILALLAFASVLISAWIFNRNSSVLFFAAGSFLFTVMVLLLRSYYIRSKKADKEKGELSSSYSRLYYFFNPTQAITPVIIIAAGVFAVIITGANRQVPGEKMLLPSGGTGGYLLWAESALPVRQDLSRTEGRQEFGLDESDLKDLEFVQAKRLSGDDASCLNLNHVTSPPVLGIDPAAFIEKGSFSFASRLKNIPDKNPWTMLGFRQEDNTIYGIADQTVLQWGLKIKTGDTLILRTEDGQPLNIIICAGLKSSVFQGHLIIGGDDFTRYFPSVSGSSVFLIDGNPELTDHYQEVLNERFSGYGLSSMKAGDKLVSFLEVTNTYLNVFTILGALGMMLGAAGLGFILLRNFNQRKREFALMAATGFSQGKIRNLILRDQIVILIWGILTGTLSGLTATVPSIMSGNEIPWNVILVMVVLITAIGFIALAMSIKSVRNEVLIEQLRKE